MGDLNQDGIPDVAIGSGSFDELWVFLGLGNGRFRNPLSTTIDLGIGSFAPVLIAELTGDGIPDLHVLSFDGFATLIGHGDGTYSPGPITPVTALAPNRQLLDDFDGDRKLDLILTANTGLYLFRGNGDGTFGTGARFGDGTCRGVQAADFDHDKKLDAVFTCDSEVRIFQGRGDGTFLGPSIIPFSGTTTVVQVGDLNADGRADLVVAHNVPPQFHVLLGSGDGSFQEVFSHPLTVTFNDVEIADVDLDGHQDLVSVSTLIRGASVWFGNGNGTLSEPVDYVVGQVASEIEVSDLRGEGLRDVITVGIDCQCFSVLLNRGEGNFQNARSIDLGISSYSIQDHDFNHDGLSDLLVSSTKGVSIYYATGAQDEPFRPGWSQTIFGGTSYAIVADFNADGREDIAALGATGSVIFVFTGDTQGSFRRSDVIPLSHDSGSEMKLTAGDFNGDGKLDLATSYVDFAYGKGDGTFSPALQWTRYLNQDPYFAAAGDINGDGRTDLLFGTNQLGDPYLVELLSTPNGLRPRFVPLGSAGTIQDGKLLDLDGDGLKDLVLVTKSNNALALKGLPGGVFRTVWAQTIQEKPILGRPVSLRMGDFNGDGRADFAVAGPASYSVTVFLGNGNATFRPNAISFGAGVSPSWVVAGQFTAPFRSGFNDLVIQNGDGTLSLLPNITGITSLDNGN